MAMLRKEYRIILPIYVEEFKAAQLWCVAEASKNETGGGEGVEVINNEPYEKASGEKGQYTKKVFHLESRAPSYIRLLAPKDCLTFIEEAWNAYPYCKTVITNAYMKDNFEICIQTIHECDFGEKENIHNLPADEWAKTEVVRIDIANDSISRSDYKKELDPSLFTSKKANRGPFGPRWIEQLKAEKLSCEQMGKPPPAYMCAYKLVSCRFKWFGLQNKVERLIHSQERRIFTNFHRQVVCWMDDWYGVTMDQIREIEDKTKRELDQMRTTGEIKGMKVEE